MKNIELGKFHCHEDTPLTYEGCMGFYPYDLGLRPPLTFDLYFLIGLTIDLEPLL